jgi:hypothetical protein
MPINYIPNGYQDVNAIIWGNDIDRLTTMLPDGRLVWVAKASQSAPVESIIWYPDGHIEMPGALTVTQRSDQVATAGQSIFNTTYPYILGTNALEVYVNGLRQRIVTDYTESSTTGVTFTSPLQLGDKVSFFVRQFTPSGLSTIALPGQGGTGQDTSSVTGMVGLASGTWRFNTGMVIAPPPTGVAGVDQAAIEAASTLVTSGSVLLQPGTYLVNGLNPSNNVSLVGCGINVTTIKLADTKNTYVIAGNGKSRVRLYDLTLDGNGTNQTTQTGAINLSGGPSNCIVERVRVINCTKTDYPAIQLDGAGTNCILRDIEVLSPDYGIQISNGMLDTLLDHCVVTGHTSTRSYLGGIYIATNCHRTLIRGCQSTGGSTHGLYLLGSNYVKIENSTFTGATGASKRGISVSTGVSGCIFGCTVTSNTENGIFVDNGATGWAIADNVCSLNGGNGIEALGGKSTVQNNIVESNGTAGIYVGSKSSVLGNRTLLNASYGILVYDATLTTVTGNVAANNVSAGIGVHGSGGSASSTLVTVIGNTCYDDQGVHTQQYGIAFTNKSTDCLAIGNTATGNTLGQVTDVGTSNTVANNETA